MVVGREQLRAFPVFGRLWPKLDLIPRLVENNERQETIYMDDPKFHHKYGKCEVWQNVLTITRIAVKA